MISKTKKIFMAILCVAMAILVPLSASAKNYNEIEVPNSIGYAITSFFGGIFNGILKRNVIEYVSVKGEYVSQSQSIKVYADASIEEVYFFKTQPVGTANLDDAVSPTAGILYCVVVLDDGHVSSAQKTQIHSHKWTVTSEVSPTCTEDGTREVICKGCGDKNTVTLPATGHSFTNYIFNDDATESFNGTETAICNNCGEAKNTKDYNPFTYEVINYNGQNVAAYLECDHTAHLVIPGEIDGYPVLITAENFKDCTDIETLYIDNGVVGIEDFAFSGCYNLKSVSIVDGISFIGGYAFEDCSSLEEFAIPSSVTQMGEGVCERCTSLESVTVGHGIRAIPPESFSYCTSLTSINIPENIDDIGPRAFDMCKNLSDVEFGNIITSVGFYAFRECAISEAVITNGTEHIGAGAFENCRNITSVSIPATVKFIGLQAFSGCSNLTEITVSDENPYFDSRDNCNAIIETASDTIVVGCQSTVIPDSVTNIGELSFFNCNGLTNITIPESVTDIGEKAFYCCLNLAEITISGNVVNIEGGAFDNCPILTDVYYTGPKENKSNITIGVGNDTLNNATWHYEKATINIKIYFNDVYMETIQTTADDGSDMCDSITNAVWLSGYDDYCVSVEGDDLPDNVTGGNIYNAEAHLFSPHFATVLIYIYDDEHQTPTNYVNLICTHIDAGSSYSRDDVYTAAGYTSDNAEIRTGSAISYAEAGKVYTFIVDI